MRLLPLIALLLVSSCKPKSDPESADPESASFYSGLELGDSFDDVVSAITISEDKYEIENHNISIGLLSEEVEERFPVKTIDLEISLGLILQFNFKDELIKIMRVEMLYPPPKGSTDYFGKLPLDTTRDPLLDGQAP